MNAGQKMDKYSRWKNGRNGRLEASTAVEKDNPRDVQRAGVHVLSYFFNHLTFLQILIE